MLAIDRAYWNVSICVYKLFRDFVVVLIFAFKMKINVFWMFDKKFGENLIQKLIFGKNTEFWSQICSTKKSSDVKMLKLDLIEYVACIRSLVRALKF